MMKSALLWLDSMMPRFVTEYTVVAYNPRTQRLQSICSAKYFNPLNSGARENGVRVSAKPRVVLTRSLAAFGRRWWPRTQGEPIEWREYLALSGRQDD